jgi:hypothetical protein
MPKYKYANPFTAYGYCLIDSQAFALKTRGWGLVRVTGLEYPGREHWAAIFMPDPRDLSDCLVRDRTMRQFSADAKPFWKGSLDAWLDDMTELLVDNVRYEIYEHPKNTDPMFADHWIREDIEPGPLVYPWEEE